MDAGLTDSTFSNLLGAVATDVAASVPLLEAEVGGEVLLVDEALWRSCTGRRWRNGVEHHGPVVEYGSTRLWVGRRYCLCSQCQSTVAPEHRAN